MVVLIPFLIIVAFLSERLVYVGKMQLVWVYVCVHAYARVAPWTRCHSNQLPVSSEVGGETYSCFNPFDAKIPTTNIKPTGIIHCRPKHGRTKTTLPFDLWLSNYVVKEIQIKYQISNIQCQKDTVFLGASDTTLSLTLYVLVLDTLPPNLAKNGYQTRLVGGFNPFEKYQSKWESSPNRGDNKKYLKPPPRRPFRLETHRIRWKLPRPWTPRLPVVQKKRSGGRNGTGAQPGAAQKCCGGWWLGLSGVKNFPQKIPPKLSCILLKLFPQIVGWIYDVWLKMNI